MALNAPVTAVKAVKMPAHAPSSTALKGTVGGQNFDFLLCYKLTTPWRFEDRLDGTVCGDSDRSRWGQE